MKETYVALREFGASFLGPPLTAYVRAVERHAEGRLPVCLAREGWLIHEVLTHLGNQGLIHLESPPVYVRLSRTLLFRAMLGERLTFEIALGMAFQGTVLDLLTKRFGLENSEAVACLPGALLGSSLSLPDDADKVREWLKPYTGRLMATVEPTRTAVANYFHYKGLYAEGLEPLMLDAGYSGTMQKLCTRILARDTAGLYFIATKPGQHHLVDHAATMTGVFHNGVDWNRGCTMLERSLLLECMMTAPHGQVVDVREGRDGEYFFFYGREVSSQRYFQDLQVVLAGAMDAVSEALRNNVVYTVAEIEALFDVFATQPGAIPQAAWHLFTADDDVMGNGVVNPLQIFGI